MTEKHRKGNKKSPLGTTQKQKNVFGSLIGYTNIDFLIQLKCILIFTNVLQSPTLSDIPSESRYLAMYHSTDNESPSFSLISTYLSDQ